MAVNENKYPTTNGQFISEGELRDHFKIKQCPNKPYTFKIWKLIGELQFGEDCWVSLSTLGIQQKYFIHVGTIKDYNNNTGFKIVLWKLSLTLGLLG